MRRRLHRGRLDSKLVTRCHYEADGFSEHRGRLGLWNHFLDIRSAVFSRCKSSLTKAIGQHPIAWTNNLGIDNSAIATFDGDR